MPNTAAIRLLEQLLHTNRQQTRCVERVCDECFMDELARAFRGPFVHQVVPRRSHRLLAVACRGPAGAGSWYQPGRLCLYLWMCITFAIASLNCGDVYDNYRPET
jgi:hypothetical protein